MFFLMWYLKISRTHLKHLILNFRSGKFMTRIKLRIMLFTLLLISCFGLVLIIAYYVDFKPRRQVNKPVLSLFKGLSSRQVTMLYKHRKRRLIFIDFSLPSSKKRLWMIDKGNVILQAYVSHGKRTGYLYARHFSNELGSHKSSLGRFFTWHFYVGQHGRSLKVVGMDSTNSNALRRKIVFHAAPYSTKLFLDTNGYLGRSHGCFTTSSWVNDQIIAFALHYGPVFVLVVG